MVNKITRSRSQARTFLHGLFVLCVCVSAFYLCDGKKVASNKVSADVKRMCRSVKWLADKKQRSMCTHFPDSIEKIKIGVDKALTECRRLFKNKRWNCSPLILDDVFFQNGILKKKSRETAFVQALSAAGVMHEVAKACARGELRSCGCGSVTAKKRRNNKKWMWGGCGDNFRYSASFAKKFLDYKRITNHAKKSTSHNYGVGRKVVRDNTERKCKCHGKSNTCTFKTCWEVVPTMEKVSDEIWKLYESPVKTRWNHKTKTLIDRTKKSNTPVTPNVLTFFANSENFCQQNVPMGIMGTVGRTCNHTSHGYDGCNTMCCGRPYKTNTIETTETCNCRFVWCCDVKCNQCNTTIIRDTCL